MNFSNKDGGKIIFELIKTIQDKKDFLSEVDGKIGDGEQRIYHDLLQSKRKRL